MTQYVALIRSSGNPLARKNAAERQAHLKAAQEFIGDLTRNGQMKTALPLEMDGVTITGVEGRLSLERFTIGEQPVAGMYLIEAADLDTAADLMKRDPRLSDKLGWQIEIRPVMALPGISE